MAEDQKSNPLLETMLKITDGPSTDKLDKLRWVLLGVSFIGFAVSYGNMWPSKIKIFEIEWDNINPIYFPWVLFGVIIFFALWFAIHSWPIYQLWILQYRRLLDDYIDLLSKEINDLRKDRCTNENKNGREKSNTFWGYRFLFSCVVFAKCVVEIILPLTIAGITCHYLYFWQPSYSLIAVIKDKPEEPGSIVFLRQKQLVLKSNTINFLGALIIPYKEAECDTQKQIEKWNGITMTPETVKYLDNFREQIISCGTKDNPVVLVVSGFASSSNVPKEGKCTKQYPGEVSNLIIANTRAKLVFNQLNMKNDPRLIVRPNYFMTEEEMIKNRYYIDVDLKKKFDKNRGLLTRRVEINIAYAGICEEVSSDKSE